MSDELLIPEADIAMAARKIVQAGRKTKRRNTGPTLTLGTIKAMHDYDGNMVADVTVRGADLLGLDMTVDCVNAQPGDRCVIQEQSHHAMVTGILAKPGAWVPVTQPLIASGQVDGSTNQNGVIQIGYSCPDGSNRTPDSVIVTYGPQSSDISALLFHPMLWSKGPTVAQIRFRRTDRNTWLESGQGLHFQWIAIWNPV